MSYVSTRTKLPLATWAQIMGIHPLHFFGIQLEGAAIAHCEQVWPQFEWQDADRVSREEVARAIAEAEAQIEAYIGFHLLPDWEEAERVLTARAPVPELVRLGRWDVRLYGNPTQARWKRFISGGIPGLTLIAASRPIVYSDADTDGYDETATVTVATTETDPNLIGVFYPGLSGANTARILPVSVSIAAGTATITFRRELAVLQAEVNQLMGWGAVDGLDDALFLDEVDVYRVFNDPSTAVTLEWQPENGCGCGNGGCAGCEFSVQTGCLHAFDYERSWLGYTPATWNADDSVYDIAIQSPYRSPDILRLYYFSGLESSRVTFPRFEMDPDWARVVAYMAAAKLDRPPCDCANGEWERWSKDLAFITGANEFSSYSIGARDLQNPFGTRAGEVHAWRKAKSEGVSLRSGAVAI